MFLMFSVISCSIYQTAANIGRLKFKLMNVSDFTLSGIKIQDKSKLSDFNSIDLLKLSSSFAQNNFPASFTLNIAALNPNDGSGGYSSTNATIKSFPWRVLLDNKETISGNINQPITVPGTGETVLIPLQVNINLFNFFKEKGYESIINLALNIGGARGSVTQITLYAKPVVSTILGDLSYPQEIKIVDYEYSN